MCKQACKLKTSLSHSGFSMCQCRIGALTFQPLRYWRNNSSKCLLHVPSSDALLCFLVCLSQYDHGDADLGKFWNPCKHATPFQDLYNHGETEKPVSGLGHALFLSKACGEAMPNTQPSTPASNTHKPTAVRLQIREKTYLDLNMHSTSWSQPGRS